MPWDTRELERFYAGLSAESRRQRFFATAAGLPHADAVSFCTPDHRHREGFVALAVVDGAERIVGHACLEPVGGTIAEIAVAVADAWQHQGIGRRLVRAAVDWAQAAGIERLTATMLPGNGPIHRLLSHLGLPYRTRRPDFDVVVLDIDLVAGRAHAA